jgi:hypothetical protein
MSPNDASGSSEIITASWYALTTQIESAGLELRSLAIRGSATLTSAVSRHDSATPTIKVRIAQ